MEDGAIQREVLAPSGQGHSGYRMMEETTGDGIFK
jgi:hypothetical protein